MVDKVVSTIGKDSVRSIFVSGSAASGEISYCEIDGTFEIYSDVDLYVVLTPGANAIRARAVLRGVASEYPVAGSGYVFCRGPDIGAYSREDLMKQPARPGTVGIAANHRVLFGDPALAAETEKFIDRRIHPTEALYLIENRLSELADGLRRAPAGGEATAQRFSAFLALKTCADVVSAALISAGRYELLRSERSRVFGSLVTGGMLAGRFSAEELNLIDACGEALNDLQRAMTSPDSVWPKTADSVVALALAEWKRDAREFLPGRPEDWRSMVLSRCRAGSYVGNARSVRAMSRGSAIERPFSIWSLLRLSRYAHADALRLSALVDFLAGHAHTMEEGGAIKRTIDPFLDRLTRACGFLQGSLEERTEAMRRAIH